MIAEPLMRVSCGVCAGEELEVVCTARELAEQADYLRRFHLRRLKQDAAGALADRAEFTQGYSTEIVVCRGCGLLFRNPRPAPETIRRAYARDHYGEGRLGELFRSQVGLCRRKARGLRHRLRPRARVLEVGSFVGGFLAAGRDCGWEMLGVDPGGEVGSFCEQRGLPVCRGTLEELAPGSLPGGWGPGGVDCVAVWNAFDQLPHPDSVLAPARRLLRPGGLLALRVPNGEFFRAGVAAMRRLRGPLAGCVRAALAWNNHLTFPYLYGYSVRTLDWLLGWHGFTRVAVAPDTLCPLADASTRWWAALEERLLKAACLAAARLDAALPGSRLALAPWLDLYYQATSRQAELSTGKRTFGAACSTIVTE